MAIVMLGCEQKNGDPQDGTAATDAPTASDATGSPGMSTTTDATRGPGMSTTSATTDTTALTTSGFEPTTVDSSASATTGDGESLCQAFCDRLIACGLGGAFDGCPCTPAEANATCFQEWKLTVECFEFDTCESLESGVSPCWKDFTKAAICGDDSCEISQDFGGDVPVDGCAFSQECLEAPNRRLVCDQAMCLCEIDGMPVAMGTCFQLGVCRDAELAAERIDACCG